MAVITSATNITFKWVTLWLRTHNVPVWSIIYHKIFCVFFQHLQEYSGKLNLLWHYAWKPELFINKQRLGKKHSRGKDCKWLINADHNDSSVYGMRCLGSLGRWEPQYPKSHPANYKKIKIYTSCYCGFETKSRHGCLCIRLFCVCFVLCIGSGHATGLSLVKGVLLSV
jgi:hypothetical protein